MKKILVIIGGGRANGNTVQLVNVFIKGAEEAGHQVEKLSYIFFNSWTYICNTYYKNRARYHSLLVMRYLIEY